MKKLTVLIVATLFMLSATTVAQTLETVQKDNSKYARVEENLIKGLDSENLGLRTNCAYWLGEMKSLSALVPLMKMFRSDEDIRARLMAANSLTKLDDGRAIFIVQRVGEFSDNVRIKRVCERLYTGYIMKQRQGVVEVKDIYQATLDQAENFVKVHLAQK